MPQEDFYAGLSLKEKLRSFAEHHYAAETRHISNYEYELLLQVLSTIPDHPEPEVKG